MLLLKHSTGKNSRSKRDGKQKPPFLAAVLDSQKPNNLRGGKPPPLGEEQCAHCKEDGHWKNDDPKVYQGDRSLSYGRKRGIF